MAQLHCSVVTPEQTLLEGDYDFIALPLYDGEIGVAANRAPLIGRLGYGELRLRTGDTVTRYYLDGGFVHILNNSVSILTGRAVPAESLKADELATQLDNLNAMAPAGLEKILAKERDVARVRAQHKVAKRTAK